MIKKRYLKDKRNFPIKNFIQRFIYNYDNKIQSKGPYCNTLIRNTKHEIQYNKRQSFLVGALTE